MFIEICNLGIGLQLMVAVDSIESFQLENTIADTDDGTDEDDGVFRLWVHLKSGESHLLEESKSAGIIQATWQKLGNIIDCTERIAF